MSPIVADALERIGSPKPAVIDVESIKRAIAKSGATDDQLRQLAAKVQQASAVSGIDEGPKNPDELHEYIIETYGINVPRKAVCHDHQSPFDFLCAVIFDEHPSVFGMGSRGGGKSYLMALAHHVKSRFRPGHQGATFGAVEHQAKRVYESFRNFLDKGRDDVEGPEAMDPKISETIFMNGSKVEIFTGTVNAVNGPHPNMAHSDEVEIIRPAVWKESRNMAQDSVINGVRIPAMNVGTSTRKWKNGRVDKLYQEFKTAIKKGRKPTFWFFIWCIFEIAQERPDCQRVPAEEREARLKELGRNPCDTCDCHLVVNDFWDDGEERTMADACRGRFFRSRGYRSPGEIEMLFLQNDRRTWEAQQECSEAEAEGLYIPSFSRRRHGITNFKLNLANGPVFTGTDWGTSAAGTTLWVQLLLRPIIVLNYETGDPMILKKGSRIAFNELYKVGHSDSELGDFVKARELEFTTKVGAVEFPVRKRYADMGGASARKDWSKKDLKTTKYDRDFETHINNLAPLFSRVEFFVVVDDCPIFCDEIESWRKKDDGRQLDEFNHLMSALRYVTQGMHEYLRANPELLAEEPPADSGPNVLPKEPSGPQAMSTRSDPLAEALQDLEVESEWRAAMGSPF